VHWEKARWDEKSNIVNLMHDLKIHVLKNEFYNVSVKYFCNASVK
jgi:hypothetical protein